MKKSLAILLVLPLSINYAKSQTTYCTKKIEQYNTCTNKLEKLCKEMLTLSNYSSPRGEQINLEVENLGNKVFQIQNELGENSCLENQKIYKRYLVISKKIEDIADILTSSKTKE
jgi:peroxiredoxin